MHGAAGAVNVAILRQDLDSKTESTHATFKLLESSSICEITFVIPSGESKFTISEDDFMDFLIAERFNDFGIKESEVNVQRSKYVVQVVCSGTKSFIELANKATTVCRLIEVLKRRFKK